MALPSASTHLSEEVLSLTAEEWERLRKWMFSTASQDVPVNGTQKAKDHLLHGINVAEHHMKDASERSHPASDGPLPEGLTPGDSPRADFPTSCNGEVTQSATPKPAGAYLNETAVDDYLSDVTASPGRSTLTGKDFGVAPARSEREHGGALNSCRSTCTLSRREAAAGGERRKRMRKQVGVLRHGQRKSEGQHAGVHRRPSPKRKDVTASVTPTPAGGSVSWKETPCAAGPRKAARYEGASPAECWSEIVQEDAGLWRVSVRKGSACITKRFSSEDSSDRLPELMFHLERLCAHRYLESLNSTSKGGTFSSAGPLERAKRSQDVFCDRAEATATADIAGADGNRQAAPAASTLSMPCLYLGAADDEDCTEHSRAHMQAVEHDFLEKRSASAGGGRGHASAQLYGDWVCKHFDQVQHYLRVSKAYVEPDATSRDRAASLALQLLLDLPQDTEQQRYLRLVTSFLNAASWGTTAGPDHLVEKPRTLGEMEPAGSQQAVAASAVASFSPSSSSRRTLQRTSCTAGSPTRVSGVCTPARSLTGAGNNRGASASGARGNSPAAVVPCDPLLSENAESAADAAAEDLEPLCLLKSVQYRQSRRGIAQPASCHAGGATHLNVSRSRASKRHPAQSRKRRTALVESSSSRQHGNDIFPGSCPVDHAAGSVATAAAQPREASGERFACTAGETETPAGPLNVAAAQVFAAAPAAAGFRTAGLVEATATTSGMISEAPDGERRESAQRRAPAGTVTAHGSCDAMNETAREKLKAKMPAAADEDGASGAEERRLGTAATFEGQAVADSFISTSPRLASASAAFTGNEAAARDAPGEMRAAASVVVPPRTTPIPLASGATSTGFHRSPQVYVESGPSWVQEPQGDVSSTKPPQAACNDVPPDEELSDEMMEAARALVGSLAGESEAMAWAEQNNFSSILQMLQAALEEPAGAIEAEQQLSPPQEDSLSLNAQHQEQQHTQMLPSVQQQHGRKNWTQQEGGQHPQQDMSQPPCTLPRPPQLQPRLERRDSGQKMGAAQHHSGQEDSVEEPAPLPRTSEQQPQSCRIVEQQNALAEEPEHSAGLCGDKSICTLLYSLLQKRLPPAEETTRYHDDALLHETSLSYKDTDCSSQNSRKVSSCAEESLEHAGKTFASHRNAAPSGCSDSSSQATDAVCAACESGSGAFSCFCEENLSLPAADFSTFSSRVTSSTSACASSSLGDVCWPPCESSNIVKQGQPKHEEADTTSLRDFDLPIEDTVHRTERAAILSNQATAAVVG